jgi:hypothetical protein
MNQLRRNIWGNNSIYDSLKKIKYLGVNSTKDVNDLYKRATNSKERDQGRLQNMERSPMLIDWQNQQ